MAGLKGEEGAARLSMMNRIISLSPVCVCVCAIPLLLHCVNKTNVE